MRFRACKGLVGLGLDGWRHRAGAAPRGGAASGAVAEAHPLCQVATAAQKIALCTLSLSMGNIEPGMTRTNR
jgi:hypothetical protein